MCNIESTSYISIWRTVVGSTAGEGVLVLIDDLWTVELLEDAYQCPTVPVICNTTAIIALPSQVAHCCKGYLLQREEAWEGTLLVPASFLGFVSMEVMCIHVSLPHTH